MRRRVAVAMLLAAFADCFAAPLPTAQSSAEDIQINSEKGQRALAAGDYARAEQAFEKLQELEPQVAEVHANLGAIYFHEHKYEQAVSALRQALKLKPSLRKSEMVLAVSLAELGRYAEALPGLKKGFESASPDTKRLCGLQLMRAYSELQQDSKAVTVALELNRIYPDDPEILYHTGRIYGNYAFLTMEKLSRVAPGSVWRHQALAEAAESQEAFDTALSEYRQVLSLDSRRVGIHYRIGRTLMARARQTASTEDLASAQKEFQEELQLDPSNGNAAYEVAEAARNEGQLEDAQRLFEQALKFHPDFEEAQLGLASVLMSLHDPQQALPHLQRAIQLNPGNEISWYRLSQAENALGNGTEAQKALAKFKQLQDQKSNREEAGKQLLAPDEVTPQQLDSAAPQ